jgi:hypothetical protein
MEHLDAVRLSAVEKYLLDELAPEQRDDFEEHFFGCIECAKDLRATSNFLNLAKSEFEARPVPRAAAPKPRRFFLWGPAFLVPALAASLLVIAYQNIVVLPHANSEVAALHNAELLPVVSLVGSNSRGGDAPAVVAPAGRPFSLAVDIPSEDRFTGYTCELLAPSGISIWHVDVSPQQAKDTVSIMVPAVHGPEGSYTLVVHGHASGTQDASELARYHFALQK